MKDQNTFKSKVNNPDAMVKHIFRKEVSESKVLKQMKAGKLTMSQKACRNIDTRSHNNLDMNPQPKL